MYSSSMSMALGQQHSRFAAVYSLLEEAVAAQVFPGCAFGVLQANEVVALDAVGRHTYMPESLPVLPSTVYDLASVTKVVATTSMAMLLHERGFLKLDQTLATILPDFACNTDAADLRRSVTIRQLLGHCSGMAGHARLFDTETTAAGLIHACLCMPLVHPPGTHMEYSDLGFILLGRALEVLAAESIASFCQREVFAPCGMVSTGFRPLSSDGIPDCLSGDTTDRR